MDSPDKSDAGVPHTGAPGNNVNHHHSAATTPTTPGSGGKVAGSKTVWPNHPHHNHRYLNQLSQLNQAADHRRLHRRFLCFPLQAYCSTCQRAHSKHQQQRPPAHITSSFQVIEEDDFSTAASPIVDLTQLPSPNSYRNGSLLLPGPHPFTPHPHLNGIKAAASVPLMDLHTSSSSNGSLLHESSSSSAGKPDAGRSANNPPSKLLLFVPKIVRPKRLAGESSKARSGGSVKGDKGARTAAAAHQQQSSQGSASKPLIQNNSQSVDVKRKPQS